MSTWRRYKALDRVALLAKKGYQVAHVVLSRALHRPPRYLPVVLLFITFRCNLRCKMCGVCEHILSGEKAQELSTEEWKTVVDSAALLGTMIISISGGEPLLRPDLFEIIRYIRNKDIAVHLCTNGVLLDARRVAGLRESGVNTVSVSIENFDREVHEALRGPNTFEPAVEGIRRLRRDAPEIRVGINCVFTTRNFRNMAAMIPFAEELDVHQVKFAPIHTNLLHKRKHIEQYSDLIFREEDLAELDQEMEAVKQAAVRTKVQTTSSMFLSGASSLYRQPRRFTCYAGYATCAINPDGNAAPCCDMDGHVSVRETPLHILWRSPEFQRLRKQVHRCNSACWDTTNTELSLRLRADALLGEIKQTWRDIGFYF